MTAAVASAKVILLGEHVVVEGAPALVVGLPTGMEARVVGPAPALTVQVDPWGLTAVAAAGDASAGATGDAGDASAGDHTANRALAALDAALASAGVPEQARRVRVHVQAGVPGRAGLGSSAALAVAVLRAVVLGADRLDLAAAAEAARLADASERVFHGRPSGVDAAIAAYGGVGLFDRTGGLRPLSPGAALGLVVADSGPRPPTGEMVAKVAARRSADAAGGTAFARLSALPAAAAEALVAGDLQALGEVMQEAREHLRVLGLETPALAALTDSAVRAGALGAKLTGAGGGGCAVAACPPGAVDAVLAAVKPHARWSRAFVLKPHPEAAASEETRPDAASEMPPPEPAT